MLTAQDLIHRLELRPHPEGGYFREVFRSEVPVRRDGEDRSAVTTIYFLLESGRHSRWHAVASDEVWHFLEGDPLELITYDPATKRKGGTLLGRLTDPDCSPVHVVHAGRWQAARPTADFALVGCTVGPGFEFDDFRFVADIPGHEAVFTSQLAEYRTLL